MKKLQLFRPFPLLKMLSGLLFLSVLIFFSVFGCNDPFEEEIVIDESILVSNQFTIDSKGGKYVLPSGIIVFIPEGAVTKSKEIKVDILEFTNVNALAPVNISENTSYLSGFTISTKLFDFKKAIQVRVPVQNLDENGLPILYELQGENNEWLFSEETIIVSNKEKYVEIILKESPQKNSLKNAGSKTSLNDARSFFLKIYGSVIFPEELCKLAGRFSSVIEMIDINATEGSCKGISSMEKFTYLDCIPPISGTYEIIKISPLCEPQVSISAPSEIDIEDSGIVSISVSLEGHFPLSEQVINLSSNSKLSISPSSQSTRSGEASFEIVGLKAGNGLITGKVFLDYYLTYISASSDGVQEVGKDFDRVKMEKDVIIDILVIGLPEVITKFYTNLEDNIAFAGGEVTEDYDERVTERGVYLDEKKIRLGDGIGSFETELQDLEPNTTYSVKAYASNRFGIAYGEEIGFVIDIDGNIYRIVTIGTQDWITQNLKTTRLNDGTPMTNVTDPYEWGSTWGSTYQYPVANGFYCWYENDITNKNIYGALYNWVAVKTGKLCPIGWHVPSKEEYLTLIEFVGGIDIGGGKLKETGTSHWKSPNTGATDEYGLTALPGGYREGYHFPFYDEDFLGISEVGVWWTSTLTESGRPYFVGLSYDYQDAGMETASGMWGGSIRCIKD